VAVAGGEGGRVVVEHVELQLYGGAMWAGGEQIYSCRIVGADPVPAHQALGDDLL